MATSLISTFAGLSIYLGPQVVFGTLFATRRIFIFLLFVGLTLSAFLNAVEANMI
jgi:hypothetical protein